MYCCLIKPVLLTKLEETVTRALAEGDEPVRAGSGSGEGGLRTAAFRTPAILPP